MRAGQLLAEIDLRGWRDSILIGPIFLASFGGVLLSMYKYLYYFKVSAHVVSHDFP